MNNFPAEEVLIARGKYATIGAERRELYKAIRDDLEMIVGFCQRATRFNNDLEFSLEQTSRAKQRMDDLLDRLRQVSALNHHMEGLRPLAWDGRKGEIE